jgi:2-iminobutanoate/2-iminopropanoate deaminase
VSETIFTGVAAHIGTYADAVRVPAGAELVFVSGTPGLTADGSRPDDFRDEVRQAWANVEAALDKAGAALTDIVSVRQWLTNADDVAAYAEVRKTIISHSPTFMLGVIDQLVWPNLRVEIEVIAAKQV